MMQKKSQKNYNQSKSLLYQIKPKFEKNIKKGLIDYIRGDNWITEYKFTEKFEKEFAKFTNSKLIISFNSNFPFTTVVYHSESSFDSVKALNTFFFVEFMCISNLMGIILFDL